MQKCKLLALGKLNISVASTSLPFDNPVFIKKESAELDESNKISVLLPKSHEDGGMLHFRVQMT